MVSSYVQIKWCVLILKAALPVSAQVEQHLLMGCAVRVSLLVRFIDANHLMMLICTSIVCTENYYRLRSTRCAACPTNSIRQLNEDDELCPCLNGYARHQETDVDQPCRRKMLRNARF